MQEIISKRNWSSKVFDTGRTQRVERRGELPIYGTTLQNGLHDIEPDGSFVECDMTIDTIANGVTTHQIKRGRYGELRFGDTSSSNKHLCKIKYKDGNGISLKYLGADSGSPIINGDVKFAAADGIQLRHIPTYKGVKIELITNDPLTASLEYAFSIKTYGQDYTYEIIKGSIIATGEDGKTITIHAPYVIDANDDIGQVHYELLGVVDEFMTFKKVVDETWLRQAAAPVRIDPDVTIEDGVDGGVLEDAWLRGPSSDANWGGGSYYHIEGVSQNAVVKVDLSSLPVGAEVVNSHFGFDIYAITAPGKVLTWYEVLANWVEGTATGSVQAGSCSWNSREHGIALWKVAGCRGTGENADRNAVADGSKVAVVSTDWQLPITNTLGQIGLDSGLLSIIIEDVGATAATRAAIRSAEATLGNKPYFYMEYTENGIPPLKLMAKLIEPKLLTPSLITVKTIGNA